MESKNNGFIDISIYMHLDGTVQNPFSWLKWDGDSTCLGHQGGIWAELGPKIRDSLLSDNEFELLLSDLSGPTKRRIHA